MSEERPVYADFLGTWDLIPESCDYEQGEPPRAGTYEIEAEGERLHFTIRWLDSVGESHTVAFSGVPDGRREPFAGGDLADELAVTARTSSELISSAYYRGVERMTAQRQLDETRQAMRLLQLVRLPDGTKLLNRSIYRRRPRPS